MNQDTQARLGEPSLGPLSRLRYFKYELQAFRAVQRQQWEVLDKMSDGLYGAKQESSREANRDLGWDPHWITTDFHRSEFKYNGALRTLAGCFETLHDRTNLVSRWEEEINHIREEVSPAPFAASDSRRQAAD